jgi:hypothetical protein
MRSADRIPNVLSAVVPETVAASFELTRVFFSSRE